MIVIKREKWHHVSTLSERTFAKSPIVFAHSLSCDQPMNAFSPHPAHQAPLAAPGHHMHYLSSHGAARYYLSTAPGMRARLDGLFDAMELAEGLSLLRVDVRDMQGVALSGTMAPGLRLAYVVGGRSDVTYGNRRVVLGPQSPTRMHCSMVQILHTERFSRRSQRGDRERTVSITISPAWMLKRLGIDHPAGQLLTRHLACSSWQVSTQAMTLVEQMLRPPELSPPMLHLYLESRALDLVVEAFAHLDSLSRAPVPTRRPGIRSLPPTALRDPDRQRMNAVRDLLESGQADALSLDAIARHAGVSVNTLQRHFRMVWSKTVFAYLRDHRLMRARIAMERDGVSVASASAIAGYASPANFATAFRKRFGITPCQVRTRG